jgi:hypothetical protein
MRIGLLLVLGLFAGICLAEAPTSSLVPQPRPGDLALQPQAKTTQVTVAAAQSAKVVMVPNLAPKPRPANLRTTPAPEKKTTRKAAQNGSVCGDTAIRGQALAAIPAKVKGCGLAEPVKVTKIGKVALNPEATISCDTAVALKQWIDKGLQPAFGNRKVIELKVAASYFCRPRNHKKAAKIS